MLLLYCLRRLECPRCGVTTEMVPWTDGKQRTYFVHHQCLAFWAKRLFWAEVGGVFRTSWGVVFRSVRWVVDWGLAHRVVDGIRAIGSDASAVWKGHKYLTVVYQIDEGVRRLLWVGRERTEQKLEKFFVGFGSKRADAVEFVASDMWKPYISVIARHASAAVHVLDRFHILAKPNKVIDEIPRER